MRRRRPNLPQADRRKVTGMDDLFDAANRQSPRSMEEELWGLRTIISKTGLARSTIYAYVKLGLFPSQRRLGPGRVGRRASEVRAWINTR